MKRIVTAVVSGVAALAVASPALGAPPGQEAGGATVYVCGGGPVLVHEPADASRVAWIGEDVYLVREFTARGFATPPGGAAEPFEFRQTYGQGPAGDPIHCSLAFDEIDAGGVHYQGTLDVWAVKAPGHELGA